MEPPHNQKGEYVSMTKDELKKILEQHLEQHKQWLNDNGGCRANLSDANLSGINLCCVNLSGANLSGADLRCANLSGANLFGANLCRTNLFGANLRGVDLFGVDLCGADLSCADLCGADLSDADLCGANLRDADLSGVDLSDVNLSNTDMRGVNLCGADLSGANLCGADLSGANLCGAKNMVKVVGVFPGNRYYKAIDENLCNNRYTYTVGLNTLREGEVFASDDRVLCSFPGFHFASESWCRTHYGDRRYLCLIRIPTKEEYEQIEINEPWATDGKASASAIIIEKVFDTKDGDKDVTDQFIGWADGKGSKTKG